MGRFLITDQDFRAKRKTVTMELLKGKEIATRLQTLLRERSDIHNVDGLDSARQLARQILKSFAGTISALSSCAAETSPQIPAPVDRGRVKDRRGCYKRRRTLDSWVTISPTKEDGFAWRKYGQKVITSSQHPRCYFRCTHKSDGCKATKQVQRTKDDEDPIMYQTTYSNHHTCTEITPKLDHRRVLVVDSDPVHPNLICFQSNDVSLQNSGQYSPNPAMSTVSSQLVQHEFREDNGQSDQDFSSIEAKSTVQDVGIEANTTLGYKPCESTSLQLLDMDVNELGDIDSLYFEY